MKKFTLGKNKKVNFIRIPKNASSSLYQFFGVTNTIRDDYLPLTSEKHKNIFAPSHCSFDTAISVLGDGILRLPTFAVVRNPYDRVVSMYCFAKKYNLFDVYGQDELNFLQFCQGISTQDDNFFHAWPQFKYFQNHKIDLIRFENLEEEFWDFLHKNNLKKFYKNAGRKLKKENQTQHENYKKYFCTESKKIIENIWEQDLNDLKYTF